MNEPLTMYGEAWCASLADASQRTEEYVREKHAHKLPQPQNAITYLYKETCMPILLQPKNTLGVHSQAKSSLYSEASLLITLVDKIHIRVMKLYTLDFLYPVYFKGNHPSLVHSQFTEMQVKEAPIQYAIVIGM